MRESPFSPEQLHALALDLVQEITSETECAADLMAGSGRMLPREIVERLAAVDYLRELLDGIHQVVIELSEVSAEMTVHRPLPVGPPLPFPPPIHG